MPINKNAIVRYQILDELLSNRYQNYSMDDLTEQVNNKLAAINPDGDNVVRRTIEKDIHFLENEDPFFATIERYSVDGYDYKRQRAYRKRCLRYADPSFSIFKKELTSDERYLLRELFSLFGQFDGLPELDGLERLRLGLNSAKKRRPIISLTKNPLVKKNLFGELFTAISQQVVVELHYHQFSAPDRDRVYHINPYLLREYRSRWYLFGKEVEKDRMMCFPLERIDRIIPLPSYKYQAYDGNLNEIFEDVIGVSVYENEPVNKILFWVSDYSKDYVLTKPLHESQRNLSKKTCDELHQQYPTLQGGQFFRIECKRNYELIRALCSYGQHLLVLEPSSIREEIEARIKNMSEDYMKLQTKNS